MRKYINNNLKPFSIQLSCGGIEYTMRAYAHFLKEEVQPNSVVTFIGLKYVPTCQVPCAVVNHNGIDYCVSPWELVKLFEVGSFEELEDVHKHTKILYKGFTTNERIFKDGSHHTITTYKFEKL